jgi:hypothetical protein
VDELELKRRIEELHAELTTRAASGRTEEAFALAAQLLDLVREYHGLYLPEYADDLHRAADLHRESPIASLSASPLSEAEGPPALTGCGDTSCGRATALRAGRACALSARLSRLPFAVVFCTPAFTPAVPRPSRPRLRVRFQKPEARRR